MHVCVWVYVWVGGCILSFACVCVWGGGGGGGDGVCVYGCLLLNYPSYLLMK